MIVEYNITKNEKNKYLFNIYITFIKQNVQSSKYSYSIKSKYY